MVYAQYADTVIIEYLSVMETRMVDGIPIEKFADEPKFKRLRKLPKDWTYSTRLFEITHRLLPEYKLDVTDPENIKDAYAKGFLVKKETIFWGGIEEEITKEGYRIVQKSPLWKKPIFSTSIRPDKLYMTYKEAEEEVDANNAEFKRQAALSDYDWSVEQIDKTLEHWRYFQGETEDKRNQYREWLLSMKNVEDIETRLSAGRIQWRYWNKTRWNNIEL